MAFKFVCSVFSLNENLLAAPKGFLETLWEVSEVYWRASRQCLKGIVAPD
jgi:hypothetical protein